MKKRRILVIMSTIVLLCCIGLTIFAALTEAIIEKHTITLDSDLLKVSTTNSNYEDYVSYTSGDTIYVDNYEDGYDLIAVTGDNSDGFVITTNQKTASYTPDSSKFDSDKSYYIVAVLYHSFNRYVDNFYDLELLNNEYRHNVVNDDLNIGNITDFYNTGGDYIGSLTSYNISNGLYDYNKQPIKSITDGVNTYTYPYSSNVLDLTKYHRNDFYDDNGNLITGSITPTNTLISDNIYFSGYFDAYGRRLDQIYYVDENQKRWNLVFTEAGIVTNGIKNNANQPQTINLSTAYYDNGIVVDDAFNSKTFKNIYILKDFETKNELSLIMPCNIHLLNNHITLNDNITLKHYYHSNYTIDTLSINSSAGGFVSINSNKFTYICPNAEINYNSLANVVRGTNDLLQDVIDFAKGYFVDYILKDKYYQVYDAENVGKKVVSYDSVNLIDGLYTSNDGGVTLTPITSITDDNNQTYTLTYTHNYVTSISDGTDVYTIQYEENKISKVLLNGDEVEDRNVYIDISSQDEYYTLFLTNPVLPKNFYDEDVTIEYTYKNTDANHTAGDDFYVVALENNQQVDITITVTQGENTKTENVSAWIMGTAKQAIADTIALKLECDINRGFSRNSTSRMYINYDTINEIVGTYTIDFTALNNLNVKDVYLEVKTPYANNNSINTYKIEYSYTQQNVESAIMFAAGEYYTLNEGVYTKATAYNSLTTYYVRNTTYTPVSDKTSYSGSYAEKYMLIERVSYSLSDGFAELRLTLTDNNTEYNKTIYAQLPRISEERYIELLKSEIGQIFFGGSNTEYQLPRLTDLQKYDVSSVTYTPVILTNGNYQTVNGVFTIDTDTYVMINNNASTTSDYYLKVRVDLKDGQTVEFNTDKIALTTTTTGGDGENDYQSSLFEKDFDEISTFIGLSNDFYLEGNVYFYLEIENANNGINEIKDSSNNVYLGLYKKMTTYDVATINATNNVYFYINPNSTTLDKVYINSSHQVPQNKPALYSAPSESDTVVGTNYRMVFLTDSNFIPSESTLVNVKAYITDSSTLSSALELKTQAEHANAIDLSNGLFDANGNPIYEITNGEKTYVMEYQYNSQTSQYNVLGVYERVETSDNDVVTWTYNELTDTTLNISGYYCNGYVFYDFENGKKIYPSNGLYYKVGGKVNILTGKEIDYRYDKITFKITYNDYSKDIDSPYQTLGGAYVSSVKIDFTGNSIYKDKSDIVITSDAYDLSNGIYDNDGNPITKFLFDDSSFTLTYDGENNCTGYTVNYTMANDSLVNAVYRLPAQQTTFYDKNGTILTIYVQNYQFTVPGIYNPNDFNWNGDEFINETGSILKEDSANASITYDLYAKLMELYGFDNGDGKYGYKEINGKNYFLLVEYLDTAIKFGEEIITYVPATSYSTTSTYYSRTGEEGSYKYEIVSSELVSDSNYSEYYVISNTTYEPVNCGGKYFYIKNLEKCPILESIYITNAKFGEEEIISHNISDYANKDFDYSNNDNEISSTIELGEGIIVHATSDKKMYIGASNKTVEGITYTHVLKTGGSGTTTYRYIELAVTPNSNNVIQIVLVSGNKDYNRELAIADSISNNKFNQIGSIAASAAINNTVSSEPTVETFVYSGSSNKIYLYSTDSQINIYAIYIYKVTSENDTLANSTLKNTLKELYLDNIIGIAGTSFDFSEYKNIEKLTITNSKLVTMPTLYRRITSLKLANNYLQDISNIETGVNLENIDLRNNIIKTFEPLRGFKTIKSLYVSGNNSNAVTIVDNNTMYLYGIPRITKYNVDSQPVFVEKGSINVTNLIQICDNNPTLNSSNTDFYSYIYTDTDLNTNAGNVDYLYCAYTLNAISYSYTHSTGLKIDLALLEKAGYSTAVYVSADTVNYTAVTKSLSNQYNYNGYYSDNNVNNKYVLISVTKNGKTLYREIYIKTN